MNLVCGCEISKDERHKGEWGISKPCTSHDLAAALEREAKLRKHAEAMADAISGWILKTREREDLADAAASYRADFPKEPR